MLSKEELRVIQDVQLEIMDEIHSICKLNNLTYYIIGGTLIGAVRHKGFIPWDVDIDIDMPRKDYDQFKKICEKELNTKYTYHDYTTEHNYTRPHALISKKNTLLKLKYDYLNSFNENWGIYIDIFPLDNAPDDKKKRRKQAKRISLLRKLKYYRIPYCYSKSRIKRFVRKMLAVMLSVISIDSINLWIDREMRLYENKKCKNMCSMASRYSYWKHCMPKEIYGQPVLLEFEGRQYCAPAKYKEFLTRIYGDYMKLPSLEIQQKCLEVYQSVEFQTK